MCIRDRLKTSNKGLEAFQLVVKEMSHLVASNAALSISLYISSKVLSQQTSLSPYIHIVHVYRPRRMAFEADRGGSGLEPKLAGLRLTPADFRRTPPPDPPGPRTDPGRTRHRTIRTRGTGGAHSRLCGGGSLFFPAHRCATSATSPLGRGGVPQDRAQKPVG